MWSSRLLHSWTLDTGESLLLLEVILFLAVDILTLQQLLKLYRLGLSSRNATSSSSSSNPPPVSLTGGKTRTFFVALLFCSNLARALSLFIQVLWVDPRRHHVVFSTSRHSTIPAAAATGGVGSEFGENDPREWWLYLLHCVPVLFFLSTYSVVVLFWAQVYYAAVLVSLPMLRPSFLFLNAGTYLVFAVIAAVTRLLGAFSEFRFYSMFFTGLLYVAAAAGFSYYGVKVASQLSSRTKVASSPSTSRKGSVVRRVLLLSVVCPMIFAVRGVYSIAFALQIIPRYNPEGFSRIAWDATVYFTTEWLPSLFILLAFWSRRPASSHVASPGLSSSSAPLLQNNFVGPLHLGESFAQPSVDLLYPVVHHHSNSVDPSVRGLGYWQRTEGRPARGGWNGRQQNPDPLVWRQSEGSVGSSEGNSRPQGGGAQAPLICF